MPTETNAPPRILRLPAVEERTGLKRDSIYRKARLGEFPAPVKLGARASGWVQTEIDEWVAGRIAARSAKRA
ncbi:MAG: AlpA family transcriptional regulator [Steroidobacteraceae bacterium]